jgi:serine/threonine-protein kinase RsbW
MSLYVEFFGADNAPPSPASPGWCRKPYCATGEIAPLLDTLVAELRAAGYSDRETFGVRLALEEAMVNAIKHGHRGDPTKVAQLRWRVTPAWVLAEVEDQGEGFDPGAVPDPRAQGNLEQPGGRGLLLMRSYMNWVRYNPAGNCVTLARRKEP